MKKSLLVLSYIFIISFTVIAQDQRILSECTVSYELSVEDAKASADVIKSLSATTKTVYIKGGKTRSDLSSPSFLQSTFYDSKSDSIVVLRELGNVRYISFLNEKKRAEQNKKFEGITFTSTNESKTILGYACKKTVAKLQDGSSFNVFYAPSIEPSNRGFDYQFKNIDGFVLEYEAQSEDGKTRIKYTANKITLTPVPVAKFDLPKTGYRVL